jgi:hypothetical protein
MPPASAVPPLELPELDPLDEPELDPPDDPELEPLDDPELDPLELPEPEPEPPELDVPASFCPPLPCDEPDDEHASHDDEARAPSARSRASRGDVRLGPMPEEG